MKVEGYLKTYIERLFERSVEYIPLKKADFELYFATGNRLVYEKEYFAGRKALTVLALKVILGDEEHAKGRQLAENENICALSDVIDRILSEPVWALPAHCPKDAWDTGVYGIDLFEAETAGSLAEILYLVKDKAKKEEFEGLLERFSDRFKNVILRKYDSDRPWWIKGDGNWTAVCSGNIGMTLIYLQRLGKLSQEEAAKRLPEITDSCLSYLEGFGSDGCCKEGVSYYSYGMMYLLAFLELLEEEGTKKGGLYHELTCKIKTGLNKSRAASFLDSAYLHEKKFVAFSDTTGNEEINPGLFAYLSKLDGSLILPSEYTADSGEFGKTQTDPDNATAFSFCDAGETGTESSLCDAGETGTESSLCNAGEPGTESLGGEECGRFAIALREYTWIKKYGTALRTGRLPRISVLEEGEWAVIRYDDGTAVSLKGGNNREPHNHNDVGNFTVSFKGRQVVAELGSGEYTADYFGEKRYGYLCTGSQGHNVPEVDGLCQKGGTGGGDFSFKDGIFTKDLSLSYGLEKGTVVRKMITCNIPESDKESIEPNTEGIEPAERNGKELVLKVEDYSRCTLTESLILLEKPLIKDGTVTVTPEQPGQKCPAKGTDACPVFSITFENAENPEFFELEYRDHAGELKKIYRVTAKKQEGKEHIAIYITKPVKR